MESDSHTEGSEPYIFQNIRDIKFIVIDKERIRNSVEFFHNFKLTHLMIQTHTHPDSYKNYLKMANLRISQIVILKRNEL